MAIKYKINRVTDANGTLEVVHPETDATQVLYENTIGSTAVTTVDGALDALKTLAQNSGVTGVKGNSETTYRTGNVNITPANIGLGNVNNTSDANKPVSTAQAAAIKVVQDQVTTLVGSDTNKSVRTVAAEETSKIVAGANTSYDTLKEIADWITSDTTGAAAMNSQVQTNKSDIAGLTNTIEEIIRGDRNVGVAEDANALGGVAADQYAKLTDIPQGELFVITGSAVSKTVSKTYNEIVAEFSNGKIPVLKYTYAGDDLVYNFAYFDEEKVVFIYTTDYARVSIVNVNANGTVTERTMLPLITVDDSNGSGPIIESITKNVADVSVTRRAMQNSDLPNSGVTAGVYSAVQVNSKGVVTAGNQLIEWGTSGQTTPSASLAVGGLFFMKV